MNYIGSKNKLIPFLEEKILSVIKDETNSFCDLFTGTSIVASHFKKLGFSIEANDIQYYSYVIAKHFIENNKNLHFTKLKPIIHCDNKNFIDDIIDFLQNIPGEKGFIYKNYSTEGTNQNEFKRQYFSTENAKKIDAVRITIEHWKNEKKITKKEYFFLIAVLLQAADKVANTASVYGAFLKNLKKTAKQPLKLIKLPFINSNKKNRVYNMNSLILAKKITSEITYLDPPYNQRQYATNYHLLETIAKYDNPTIYGKTGLRPYNEQKSTFCSKLSVKKSLITILENINSKYIFLSYNNEGLIPNEEIELIFKKFGDYKCFTKEYQRFKADKNRKHKYKNTTEFLHCLIK